MRRDKRAEQFRLWIIGRRLPAATDGRQSAPPTGAGNTSTQHRERTLVRCDVTNCGREADVARDGRCLCSWHWSEYQFEIRGVWVNPRTAGQQRGKVHGTDRAA
ncbi:MAG: hypothetical protein ACYSUQ_04020 [Planctomycetota bacterium]